MSCGNAKMRGGTEFFKQKVSWFRFIYAKLVLDLGFPNSVANTVKKAISEPKDIERTLRGKKAGVVAADTKALELVSSIEVNPHITGGIDWATFLRNLGSLQSIPTSNMDKETSIDEFIYKSAISSKITANVEQFISDYRKLLREQFLDDDERKKYVEQFHPAFIPRTRFISSAIKSIESNDLEPLHSLLKYSKDPFNTNVRYHLLSYLLFTSQITNYFLKTILVSS